MTAEERLLDAFKTVAAHHYQFSENLPDLSMRRSATDGLERTALLIAMHMVRADKEIPEVIKSHLRSPRVVEVLNRIEKKRA